MTKTEINHVSCGKCNCHKNKPNILDKIIAKKATEFDLVGSIMAWESGEMSSEQAIDFFSKLVANGMAWTLQGCYGRQAQALIDAGFIEAGTGKVLKYPDEN